MATTAACFLDLYDTLLTVDFAGHNAALVDLAGVDRPAFANSFSRWARSLMDGTVSLAHALDAAVRACGRRLSADELEQLVDADLDLLREHCTVPDDTFAFLQSLSEHGIRTAVVSNCAASTRGLLSSLGVDELVLSCEVGATKPDASIYRIALARLRVDAGQAVLVDDRPEYCADARAIGIHALQVDWVRGQGDAGDLLSLLPLLDRPSTV